MARARHEALLWAFCFAGLVLSELALRGASPSACVLGAGLSAGFGFLCGGGIGIVSSLAERAGRARRVLASVASGAGCAWYLIDGLNLLPRLQGGLRRQALLGILAAIGVGLLLSSLLLAYWRVTDRSQPVSRTLRHASAGILVLGTCGAFGLDAVIPADIYPPAHVALRAATLLAAGLGASCIRQVEIPGGGRLGLAVGIVGLVPWLVPWSKAAAGAQLSGQLSSLILRSARLLSDVDGDGYASGFAHGDCAPFDRHIGPGRPDVPGNEADENCWAGPRVVPTRPAPKTVGVAPAPGPLSVVLITVDSLRADQLSVYGAAQDTTPSLARWADRATRFDRAYTSGGWTSLALPSLFYGLYPRRLAWTRLNETNRARLLRTTEPLQPGEVVQKVFALPLNEKRRMLTSLLKQAGVRTGAVVDDGFSGYLDRSLRAFPDFDEYVEVDELPRGRRNDVGTTDSALEMLEKLATAERFFLWVHYFGPHAPTVKHPEVPSFGNSVAAGYAHEVRFTDLQLGRLLARLETLEPTRPLAVFITADHGEDLTRYERHHGLSVNPGSIHIPLLLRTPSDRQAIASSAVVSLADVMPTVLGLYGIAAPEPLDGIDLRLSQDARASDRVVMAETWRFNRDGRRVVDQVAAISASARVVFDVLDQSWSDWEEAEGRGAVRRSLMTYLEQVSGPVLGE